MVFRRIICQSPDTYQELYKKCVAETNSNFYLWFNAAKDSNGVAWCGDCRRAEPIIIQSLENLSATSTTDVIVMECIVERTPYKTNDYYYRTLEDVKLTCVPTLIKVRDGNLIGRLDDAESQIEYKVKELLLL